MRGDARLLNNRSMAELLLPPSRKRVRAARALGVRPRSGLLMLAAVASLLVALLELRPHAERWLSDQLALAFTRGLALDSASSTASLGVVLLALLGAASMIAVGVRSHARAHEAIHIPPRAEQLSGWITVTLVGLAVVSIVIASRGALAAAARSVDASPEALAHVWSDWVRRGLLTLAVVAACVGVIERQLSARRLWLALHQTPAQAREEARASGRRPARKR